MWQQSAHTENAQVNSIFPTIPMFPAILLDSECYNQCDCRSKQRRNKTTIPLISKNKVDIVRGERTRAEGERF